MADTPTQPSPADAGEGYGSSLSPARSVGESEGGGEAASSVCVGIIAAAHGVRGQVKVKPFTADPQAIAAYGPVEINGQRRKLSIVGSHKGTIIAMLEGITDRDQAEALKGAELCVPRAALPEPEADEFYHADLVGLAAVTADGQPLGRVRAVQNFGAGDLVELEDGRLVPFSKEMVPEVDLAEGRLVVDLAALQE